MGQDYICTRVTVDLHVYKARFMFRHFERIRRFLGVRCLLSPYLISDIVINGKDPNDTCTVLQLIKFTFLPIQFDSIRFVPIRSDLKMIVQQTVSWNINTLASHYAPDYLQM